MYLIRFHQFSRFCKSTDELKRAKVSQILEKLINLTIEQKEMYPSIQAKIWGSIGQVFGTECAPIEPSKSILLLFGSSFRTDSRANRHGIG